MPPEQYAVYKQSQLRETDASIDPVLEWKNVNEVFLVNGHIEKSDANFVGNLTFQKIGEEHIFIGPYPQTEQDIEMMANSGVTGVFNVQTEIDHAHRGIDWPRMCSYYSQRGIEAVHYPIHDFNQDDLT